VPTEKDGEIEANLFWTLFLDDWLVFVLLFWKFTPQKERFMLYLDDPKFFSPGCLERRGVVS